VVYLEPYPNKESLGFLSRHPIDLLHFEGFSQRAFSRVFLDEPRD
jgi:hypothetical protein